MHKQFGDEADRDIMFKIPKNLNVPREEEIANGEDLKEQEKEIYEKMRINAEQFEENGDEYLKRLEKIENGEIEEDIDEEKEE